MRTRSPTVNDRRTTIALVVPGLELGGGVPSVARFLAQTILRAGCFDLRLVSLSTSAHDDVSVLLGAPASWMRGVRTREGVWEGLPFIHIGASAGDLEFQRYRARKSLAHALVGTDLIQVVSGSPAWANAVLGVGKPVALQVATLACVERRLRDSRPTGLAGWWRKAMTEITGRLDNRALLHVDAIQVENPWMFEYARGLNGSRAVDLRYAPPGIDSVTFHPLDVGRVSNDPYILCVGRFSDIRKNVGLLLEAYARLPDIVRDRVRLLLAGASGPPEEFWRRVGMLGLCNRVVYVPQPNLDALVELYRFASVFALPSDEEGLGVVVLEAMACGIPVVSTRSGGPEGIITDGDDGFLVDRDDPAALSLKLAEVLEDATLRSEMGRRARLTILRRFDQRAAGEVFVDMWRLMLHPRTI